MTMKRWLCVALVLLLPGCAAYSLVPPGSHSVKGISVTAETSWNKAPTASGRTIWTANGLSLDSVTFFEGIQNEKPLYNLSKKAELPVFRSDMLPNEIVEVFESTVAKMVNSTVHNTANLRPADFGGVTGFQFDYSYIGGDNVPRKGMAAGAVRDGKLYMIAYEGAATHYYDLHKAEAERMIAGARLH